MGHNKGETNKQQQHLTPSPKDPLQESTPPAPDIVQQDQPTPAVVVVTGASNLISSTPVYIEAVNPKRPRYTTGQWKLLPSPTQKLIIGTESTPPPQPLPVPPAAAAAATAVVPATATSSGTPTSSPAHSPRRSLSAGESKPETEQKQRSQFRKGKYVSPVWKPNEMLWLARAWKVQYHGGATTSDETAGADPPPASGRGKTRADKDREVAEFLNRHGVNRDAKTAGTKWDNMLGEFRKVYEWERGGEREQLVGKSYFRLSPYERKLHRLPASFDEEVFEELSQYMGSRLRTSHQSRGGGGASSSIFSGIGGGGDDSRSSLTPTKSLSLPLPPFREEHELPLTGRGRQVMVSGGQIEPMGFYGSSRGGLLGFETSSLLDVATGGGAAVGPSSTTWKDQLRRIGKVRMVWEESVSLWGEEGEHHRGRVKLQGSSFLNADELTFLDNSMVACTMEAFEDGSLRAIPPWEFQDPTDYYIGCFKVAPPTLPTLFELPWHLQEPPPEDLRFPLRKDVYRDLPQGKELFFTTSTELLDSRAITFDLLGPIIRQNPSLTASTASSRDSFIGLWDDCINRIISKFCSLEMILVRKPPTPTSPDPIQDQWPNVTGFVRSFCLWRGEETDQLRDGHLDPSSTITEKLMWTYSDHLPYLLGYHAVGCIVTFCAFCRTPQDRISRTDLYTVDLSSPSDRLKALVPCWRIACLLPLLADRCTNLINNGNPICKAFPYSDFERIDLGNGNLLDLTPNLMTKYFSSKRKWGAVKEIYDFLEQRIPHSEYVGRFSEIELSITFKPRGYRFKPENADQLIEALKNVTESLVALHDLSFTHRDLCWEKVMRTREGDWFLTGFEEATGAPQIYPHTSASGRQAPEMGRGLHGVKVDVWGVGNLVKTCGLVGVPKILKELQNRCLDHNPEQRPTAADCYHHLLQLQSSLSASGSGGVGGY
ncbi:hypothetical protein LguiA_034617 [Lonicera macranthoides]